MIWCGGAPTDSWTTWAVPMSRSRSVAIGSSSVKSNRRWPRWTVSRTQP
ncbi:Uncharacterised protein [Mycobacteroides abscessus subsp. abscessus]|nr:Uncharacterised protein [Mycobacteroides abscessus subsp. abscessus]